MYLINIETVSSINKFDLAYYKNVLFCNISASFEVECLFSVVSGDILTVETVLHHQSEAPVTVSFFKKSINPQFTATTEQIEQLLDWSSCRQFFSAECSHYLTARRLYWSDKQSHLHTALDSGPNCSCPYVDQCNTSKGRYAN